MTTPAVTSPALRRVNAPPDPAPALGHLLHRIDREVSRRVEGALRGAATMDQWRVLGLLADGAGHPMSEIAAYAGVPAPTLTKIVDRLVDAALVHRRVDDADRRRVLVFLSAHGADLHAQLAPAVARVEREVAESLGGDASDLHALLSRLAEQLG